MRPTNWIMAGGRLGLLALLGLLAVPQPGRGMTWALLIGVENYQHADISRAENAANDPGLLAGTLGQRGNVDLAKRIRVLNDNSPANLKPTRANIGNLLSTFPANAQKDDRLIVFFSGHGFRDKDGKTYLAPIDCDPARLAETGIELAVLRQALRRSEAGSKFLILDACHAGSPKGGTAVYATASDLKADLKDETGIYTLASCEGDQKSYPLNNPKKRFGLFTYWLNMGLEGAATNGSTTITADSLFNFVRPIVARMSGNKQVPDRIVQAKSGGEPVILELLPERLPASAQRLATHVHEHCQLHGINSLCIAEFSVVDPLKNSEKLQGALGRNLAANLQEKLQSWPNANYKVFDSSTTTLALKKNTGPQDLPDIGNLERLKEKFNAGALLWGTLEPVLKPGQAGSLVPAAYKLNAKLTGTDGTALGFATTLIDGQDNVVSVTGGSAIVPRREVIPRKIVDGKSVLDPEQIRSPTVKDWLRLSLTQPHPLFDPDCPYQLRIRDADGITNKPLIYKKEDPTKVYVKVRRGENPTLYLANRTGTVGGGSSYSYGIPTSSQSQGLNRKQDYNGDVFVRLWVDGLNVLGQKPDLPEEAWPWVFPPQSEKVIRGWHLHKKTADGLQDFEVRPFKIVEAPDSIASRKRYDQDIGQVTAFFYAATEMNWLRKLGFGEEDNIRLRVLYPSYRQGEQFCLAYPLAWITIHYVEEEEKTESAAPGLLGR